MPKGARCRRAPNARRREVPHGAKGGTGGKKRNGREEAERARKGGAEIVNLLKTGSAYYAPSSATVAMAESIIRDKKRVMPCAAYCDKEFGIGGYFVGVPCILGTEGVEKVVEVELTKEERAALDTSVEHVRELVEASQKFLSAA